MTWCRGALVCLGLLALLARGAAGAGRFENLGPQLSARTFQAAAFAREADGRDVLCAVVRSQPAAKLLAFDAAGPRLLAGVGVQAPHLVELDLQTGARREWLPEKFPGEQSVYGLALNRDCVFAMLMPSRRTLVVG